MNAKTTLLKKIVIRYGKGKEEIYMSTRSTKTIDDLGVQSYVEYEEGQRYFEKKIISESKNIADQLTTDVFEPVKDAEFLDRYEMGKRKAAWGSIDPPMLFNRQKRRLFTHQLAPKLGPQELLDAQIDRIEAQRELEIEKRKGGQPEGALSWEAEKETTDINKEANKLIELLQDIDSLNKIVQDINGERCRYKKG